jgi:lipopolysaccharide/colanic/teichoic acid biosynthesis glycosyltransferase
VIATGTAIDSGNAPDLQTLGRRIWNLDAVEIHDRRWRARGVHIVRRAGTGRPVPRDGLYLLLDRADLLVLEDALPLTCRGGREPALLVLELREPSAYRERVDADERRRLVRVARDYPSTTLDQTHVVLTRSIHAARAWRRATSTADGRRSVRTCVGLHDHGRIEQRGRLLDATEASHVSRFLESALERTADADTFAGDVRQVRPGVWAHHSATIDRDVRFIPPVWIGAGVELRRGDMVIGPWIAADTPDASPEPATLPPVRDARGPRRSEPGRRARRLFDVLFAAAALLVTSPLLLLTMIAIWIEDGRPFFFAHRRQTEGGREFNCIKFRTMCRNAEDLKNRLAFQNDSDGPQFHMRNDPRLLTCGRLLRKFHVDELPQFWNVLRGEMSVVGPRPSPANENQYCPAWREARLSVKPGVTGLWQVQRTRERFVDFQEWIRYDLEYVERRTWRLDAWIILQTIAAIICGR